MEKALSYKYDANEGQNQLCFKNVPQVGEPFDRQVLGLCDDLDLPKF